MKHGHALWVACLCVGHLDMRWICVGHATWRVVDQIRSQKLRTRLDIFHGFFFLCIFFNKIMG